MLMKAALLLDPAAQFIWLGSHIVVFSSCELQTARVQHAVLVVVVTSQLLVAG